MMSAVRNKDTNPELIVRKAAHSCGLQFRLHDGRLPGRPDLVLRKRMTVIFVNGCFWHRHSGCKRTTTPSSNIEFWTQKALLRLNREIEVVTLEGLITKFRERLARDSGEKAWQTFFKENPFILKLAFGYPVIQFGEEVSVGGERFDGSGEKIADFAVQAAATGNLALIEIKTPAARLLDATPYRGGVFAPHRDLSGAVTQILDQRHQLEAALPLKKSSSGIHDIHSYAIQGVVIAGLTPTDRDQQKSLELFRHSLNSVLVITFDEMLAKLEDLLTFLRSPSSDDASENAAPYPGEPSPVRAGSTQ